MVVASEMFKSVAVLSQLSIICNISMKLDLSIGYNGAVTCWDLLNVQSVQPRNPILQQSGKESTPSSPAFYLNNTTSV